MQAAAGPVDAKSEICAEKREVYRENNKKNVIRIMFWCFWFSTFKNDPDEISRTFIRNQQHGAKCLKIFAISDSSQRFFCERGTKSCRSSSKSDAVASVARTRSSFSFTSTSILDPAE